MTTVNTYGRGVNKVVAFGTETTFGVASTAAGQQLRRVTSNFALNTSLIPSAEIIPSQQIRDSRQGPRAVSGTLNAQLSPGTYSLFMAALLRGTFTALPSTGTLTDLLMNSNGGALPPYTFIVGSAATVLGPETGGIGYENGDMLMLSTLTGTQAPDNSIPWQVQGNQNGGKSLLTFWGLGNPSPVLFAGGGVTGKIVGAAKRLITPAAGSLLFPSFTIEEYQSDVGISDLFLGCMPTQMQIQLPARGWCSMNMTFLGQNMTESTSQFFTGAAVPTTAPSMMMLGGSIQYASTQIAYMVSASISISAAAQNDPVIGEQLSPYIFLGNISCTGSFQTLLTTDTMTTDFLAENEVSLSFILATANSPTAGFITIWLPRVKLGAATKQDSPTAITRSYTFQALENVTVPYAPDSTVCIYDSGA